MRRLLTFEERFDYLKLNGIVGDSTFGFDRYINQTFYHSYSWRRIRDLVIIRDDACDLGILGREIRGPILIHHINPITIDNIENRDDCVFDLENLIATSYNTHQAIHYGDKELLIKIPKNRSKGDTDLWTVS